MRRLVLLAIVLAACSRRHEPQPRPHEGSGSAAVAVAPAPTLSRADWNRFAVRKDLPVFWIDDANGNGIADPDEIASLLFYPDPAPKDFAAQIAKAAQTPITDPRIALVAKDLDQGRPTLVQTKVADDQRALVGHMQKVAELIDHIYDQQTGAAALVSQLPPDPESHSLFRRNHGPKCIAPATEHDPQCSAIPGSPKQIVGLYPADLQAHDDFCKQLEARHDAKALLGPFTVVQGYKAVPYCVAY